ncbi:MAG: hypothetical protein JWQ72_3642 [Polaromonas sp.]|nr:hypothetical protein [Polaromonas sp.]
MNPADIRLSDLLARTEPVGNCLLWTAYASNGRFPRWTIGGTQRPARRVVYEAIHGPLPRRLQVSARCNNSLCVHPDCLFVQTRSKALKGRRPSRSHIANVASSRRKTSRITIEVVRQIRASTASNTEAGAEHGLHRNYIARIRRNEAWVDFASPFCGLGARA